jgi:hypothetical protein
VSWVIGAILVALALFGALRARAVVGETWGIRSRATILGTAAVAVGVLFLLAFSRSLVGIVVGGVVLGIALYGGWRLRRV